MISQSVSTKYILACNLLITLLTSNANVSVRRPSNLTDSKKLSAYTSDLKNH